MEQLQKAAKAFLARSPSKAVATRKNTRKTPENLPPIQRFSGQICKFPEQYYLWMELIDKAKQISCALWSSS